MNLFILGEHHIMRDSHWPRSVAPTTTRISGFHMVLLSKMHGCSCCSNLNPLTTIETFFFCVCKPLKLSGVSGGIPSAFPRKAHVSGVQCQLQRRTKTHQRNCSLQRLWRCRENSMGGFSGSHTWSILIYCIWVSWWLRSWYTISMYTIHAYNYMLYFIRERGREKDICHLCLDGRQAFPAMAPLQRHKGRCCTDWRIFSFSCWPKQNMMEHTTNTAENHLSSSFHILRIPQHIYETKLFRGDAQW